ncbi:methyl-accepting chemotaxis protein [Paenibacillus endophyticus]|uniref:Methyl-accepting chemotaxis protein n=1 Tax=Paenibacillus endophyticus TaxID=1294268 RepID=A0A7W5G886_9BACL|nr:HAMP domain-containing methyl-accepting chemotaxis protein [Paenibacillus endophyticus]MBB3150355.1 methyl-accepting chemotaxis protein [Paenibacillus endophyticus]
MKVGISSLTNKFMLVMAAALILIVSVIMVFEWQSIRTDVEKRLLDKGRDLSLSLAHTLEHLTELDLNTGVVLQDGTKWAGDQLRNDLFHDELTVNAQSIAAAETRAQDADYATKKITLHNGESIPLHEYELKYDSAYDKYTDDRWQGIIDSFLNEENVVYAMAAAYSDNPNWAGYIATHNGIYSPEGEQSADAWGDKGFLSQNYRANRIFNDETGYNAVMNVNTDDVYLQKYDRIIDGKTVETWDVSYPLIIDGEHWGAVRVALSKEKAEARIAEERMKVLLQLGSLVAVVLVILFFLSQIMLGRKLREIVRAAVNLNSSEADLTYRIVNKGTDEIAILGLEINRFIEHMQSLMRTIRSNAASVSDFSITLSEGSHQSKELSFQLASSVDEMAAGAENQADGAAEVAHSMEEMAASVGRIAASSSIMSKAAGDMLHAAEVGNEKSEQAVAQMERLGEATSSVAQVIGQLNEQSAQIQEMAGTIAAIASQTNLLALNAAIEAAHAGEYGSGFAVVAGEIRKLAEQASDNARHIADTINHVLTSTSEAVTAVRNGEQEMEQGMTIIHELKQSFDLIWQESRHVSSQVQDVSASTEEMAAGSEQVSASVETMAMVARDTSSHAAQSAEGTNRQHELAIETEQLAQSVSELAAELRESIGRFKLE